MRKRVKKDKQGMTTFENHELLTILDIFLKTFYFNKILIFSSTIWNNIFSKTSIHCKSKEKAPNVNMQSERESGKYENA